jgi:glycerol-3-phosphate dehydrogenase subunit B
MLAGVRALRERPPCLLIDIRGLRGFSARQIAAVWDSRWPALRTVTIDFPGSDDLAELYTETMARQLERPQNLDALAARIKPHQQDAVVVGLPAILGVRSSPAVTAALAESLAVPVFEIPTMPPGVPGLRLRDTFSEWIAQRGVRLYRENRVRQVHQEADESFTLTISGLGGAETIRARRLLLAGGRFLGKGLLADQTGLREPLLDLPVCQPASRQDWHRRHFLDHRGHAANRAGLETDAQLRPLAANGQPVFKNLYAAGSILAHQDWMRQKCGSGLALATAFAAVAAMTA